MEKEAKSQRPHSNNRATETDFGFQWGNRKRLRCVKVKDQSLANKSDYLGKKKITSRVDRRVVGAAEKDSVSPQPHRINKNSDLPMNNRKTLMASPEKEDRYYTTRGSLGLDDNGKVLMDHVKEDRGLVWPKLFITLSSKEKEEDFMAMKGCKLPQRPKKRAKLIQKSLLLVSPGAWLSDLCQERYEVREKKASKKRPRGLKAMGSMDSDSE
ncbi:glycosyltransferase-like protein gnt15 [Fagus crenata]